MIADLIGTVLTGVGVLFGVWRIVTVQVEGVRRDLTGQIAAVTNQIAALNTRIDNILAGRADRLQHIESGRQRIESGRRDFLKHRLGGAAATVALGLFVNSMPMPALWTLFTPRRPIHHRVDAGGIRVTATLSEPQVTLVPAPPPIAREVYRV